MPLSWFWFRSGDKGTVIVLRKYQRTRRDPVYGGRWITYEWRRVKVKTRKPGDKRAS